MFKLSIIFILIVNIGEAKASPIFVSDNRIEGMRTSPDIGQGYHFANNRLHGNCLTQIDERLPTFDLKYNFLPITNEFFLEEPKSNFFKIEIMRFLRKHYLEYRTTNESEADRPPAFKVKNLALIIEGYTQGEILDEFHSPFSKYAENLLTENRLGEFFNHCGFFYIRGLVKKSAFIGLFQYKDQGSPQKNKGFENWLITNIKQFNFDGIELFASPPGYNNIELWFQYKVIGLSKTKAVQYNASDIEQIRETIKGSVINLQKEGVGRITQIEIRPWLDMALFQEHIAQLPDKDHFFSLISKNNMETNTRILSETNRIIEDLKDTRYLNHQCEGKVIDFIDIYHPENPPLFQNHNFPFTKTRAITAEKLLPHLEQEAKKIYEIENDFLNGGSRTPGALGCYNRILNGNLSSGEYLNLPSCQKIINYRIPAFRYTQNYCLPELFQE